MLIAPHHLFFNGSISQPTARAVSRCGRCINPDQGADTYICLYPPHTAKFMLRFLRLHSCLCVGLSRFFLGGGVYTCSRNRLSQLIRFSQTASTFPNTELFTPTKIVNRAFTTQKAKQKRIRGLESRWESDGRWMVSGWWMVRGWVRRGEEVSG